MTDRYSVRQSMSIVLFIIDNVLSDVDVALDMSSVLRVGLGGGGGVK
jgi:hypothetical protein